MYKYLFHQYFRFHQKFQEYILFCFLIEFSHNRIGIHSTFLVSKSPIFFFVNIESINTNFNYLLLITITLYLNEIDYLMFM